MERFTDYARQELADLHTQLDAVQQQMVPLQQTYEGLQAQVEALTTY